MRRRDRMTLMIEAMRRIAAREADWATFEDAEHPENYIQLADFGRDGVTFVEVTCRDWGGPGAAPLNDGQVEALAALGFGRERDPNHSGYFAWPDAVCIAKLCETAFGILGLAEDFDLCVAAMGFWKRASSATGKAEAMAKWSAREGRPCPTGHPDACTPATSP